MKVKKHVNPLRYIAAHIPEACMYDQLAEECTELAKAAMKMSRILREKNPTPITREQALADIEEEYTDVYHIAVVIFGMEPDMKQIEEKNIRWCNRIHDKIQEMRNKCEVH